MTDKVHKVWRAALPVTAVFLLLVMASSARAGWVVREADGDFPEDPVTYYLQGDRVRVEGMLSGLVILVDIAAGEGYIIDEETGRYAGGTREQIDGALREYRGTSTGGTAPAAGGEETGRQAAVLPAITIVRAVDEEGVAGLRTDFYRLMRGEELVEELWIAAGVNPLNGNGMELLFDMLEAMTGGGAEDQSEFPPGYEGDEPYRQLLRSGFPVRRIRYYVGEKSRSEVLAAEERGLSSSLFSLPPGLEKVGYAPLFFGRR